MLKLLNFHLLQSAHRWFYSDLPHPISSLLEAVLPETVRYVRVTALDRAFFSFSNMSRSFPSVKTFFGLGHMLKSASVPSREPLAMLSVFPSLTKVFVNWDPTSKYALTPLKGIELMDHVYEYLGEGWEGETRVIETEPNRRRVTSVSFLKR